MRSLINILFLILTTGVSAQNYARTIDDIIDQLERKAGLYRISGTYLKTAVINMSYGSSEILSVMNRKELQKAEIIQIDVVYTDYPKGQDISELNKQRILKILGIRSDLVKNQGISWSMVRQMYCRDEAEAKMLFHGAVIYYLPQQDQTLFSSELERYENLPKDDKVIITEDSLKQFKDDPVIIKAFERNNWKNPTVVADVTCSMYPYMKQMTFWFLLKMNRKENTNITFFNDGDGKANHLKRVGSTGGIHSVSTDNYEVYRQLLLKAVSYGCSGDYPENDVEAILVAQKKFPNSTEIILIADNFATMRDYEMISQIKKPVRVILCGTKYGVNPQYLNLARETGGSVHTIERDLENLIEKAEGDTFAFMGKRYIIKDGKIAEIIPTTKKI